MTPYNIPVVFTDTKPLEDEINSKFAHNPDFDINNIEVFVEITQYSYIPLESTVDDNGEIRIKSYINPAGLNLYVGSKHQFIHKRLWMKDDQYKIELDEVFKTAWNKDKFLIFKDGYLMNSGLFTYIIPSFENNYLKKIIYSTAKFDKGSRIDIFYIESDDNFNKLPISRDVYLGALKYTAIKNNERIIKIPYPHEKYKRSSFFIFNESGEYLDSNTDYIISYDGKYITLKNPLKLATVDYIIFAFPQLSKEDIIEPIKEEEGESISGTPYFKYSYSVPTNYNETGLVRFYPVFDSYYITKKNFLLFGNGQWISPDRFDIHSNDSIIFNNKSDIESCSYINYTMVIFDDNTDKDSTLLPRDFMIIPMKNKEENQTRFDIEAMIDERYKTFIIFKDNYIMTDYDYDDETRRIYFKNPVEGEFYCIFFSSIVNNTKQDALVHTGTFECFRYGSYGTKIPDEFVESIEERTTLLFLNGAFLEPSMYKIKDGRVYLDTSFYLDKNGNPILLDGYVFSIVILVGAINQDKVKVNKDEVEEVKQLQDNLEYNYIESAYMVQRQGKGGKERGVIELDGKFDGYKLTKRNVLLYNNGGMWIDPSRYELINNDELFLVYPFDQDRSLYTTYNTITLEDKNKDDKYNPPNILLKQVIATEENQSIFEIPEVHRRFRSFLLYKGVLLLNKEFNYVIENDKVKILHEIDYMSRGRTLTFIFLDAYSRKDQENLFIQSSFECNVNRSTEIPKNFLTYKFTKDRVALFLNGLYLSPDKYEIDNSSILLDGFIELEELDKHIFTLLYLTTVPTFLKEYDYVIPSESDIPIRANDIIPYATWQYSYSSNTTGRIIQFNPTFNDFALTKENFLLFGDNVWIHPKDYELYSNNLIVLRPERTANIYNEYTMAIIDDSITDRDFTSSPIAMKVIDVEVDSDKVEIPIVEEHYRSFIVFYDNKIVDLDSYRRDDKYIYLDHKYKTQLNPIWSFVFLHSTMNIYQQVLFYQESFIYEGDNTEVKNSIYNKDGSIIYSLYFVDGKYYNRFKYSITDGKITIPEVDEGSKVTVLYLISVVDEDYTKEIIVERPEEVVDGFRFSYSYSDEIENKDEDNEGIVTFSPRFSEYLINERNYMLFSNGTWISPERYHRITNTTIQFRGERDKERSLWTHYTMVIPNEGHVEDDEYTPVTLNVYSVKATLDKQRIFDLPKQLDESSTYLIFLGSLLMPMDEDRIYLNDKHQLILMNENDYVDEGRHLYFVTINDSSASDRRYPLFVQETFAANIDPSRGTLIPSDLQVYEDQMMLFLGGTYLDQSRYDIIDHKIYLVGDFEEMDNPYSTGFIKERNYTIVYLASKIIEDSEEEIKPIIPVKEEEKKERYLPEDDPLDYSGYYFAIYTSDIESKHDYIEYLESFDTFELVKENFLLFANSTWIHPLRFNLLNNHSIEMIDPIDKAHSEWAHYNMIFPFNKTAYDIYQRYYIKPEFKILEIITEEDTKEIEMPILDIEYESLLIFRNSLILPINDEDRFAIDDINHRFFILNEKDYIPKGTRVSFIFFNSRTNTDQRVLLVQESFKCVGLETQIPNSIYRYGDQKFNKSKMLLYLNGTYVHPDRYRLSNNIIYLIDDEISINDDHVYIIVYLDVVDNEELGIETNIIERTYEEGLDDIIFEEHVVGPSSLTFG